MKLIVTGGAGFIGSAFVRMLASSAENRVTNLDKLTYAGNLDNLAPVANKPNYRFVRGDITDSELIDTLIDEEQPDAIVHFAAESHVDRSILSPSASFETNLRGTFTLLEAVRKRKDPALCSRIHRRSVRKPRRAARGGRELSIEAEQPVLRIQSRLGSACALLFHDVQMPGCSDARL